MYLLCFAVKSKLLYPRENSCMPVFHFSLKIYIWLMSSEKRYWVNVCSIMLAYFVYDTPKSWHTTLHTTAMISCVHGSQREWGIGKYIFKRKTVQTKIRVSGTPKILSVEKMDEILTSLKSFSSSKKATEISIFRACECWSNKLLVYKH